MKWSWRVEDGYYVLRPHPLPPELADVRFVGRTLGAPEGGPRERANTVRMEQVHGAVLRWAEHAGSLAACDAVRTRVPGLELTVRTADCIPVILSSPGAGVAALHAGWRGVVAGVVEATMSTFPDPASVQAFLGPAIGPCCFEVGSKVAAQFPDVAVVARSGKKPRVDLGRAVVDRLGQAGISPARISDARICTRCHQHLLYSHRGSGGERGRVVAFAVARDARSDQSHAS